MKTPLLKSKFTLTLWLGLLAVMFSSSIQAQTPIACGQTITGTTTTTTQIDQYSYNGTAGQMLSLAFYWGFGSGLHPGRADIYGPNGQLMTNVLTAFGSAINFTLPTSGTYTILVHAAGYEVTANYSVSIQSVTGGGVQADR